MSRQRNIAAAVVAVALCAALCWSCGSGSVDGDADARGLIVKIGEPGEPPPPPPPPPPSLRWVQMSPANVPPGR
jgi:hypothetical protein